MRKTWLICLGVLGAIGFPLIFSAGAALAEPGKTQFVNVGSGGIAGGYYPTAGFICHEVNSTRKKYGHNIRCTVESTGGAASNLRALRSADLEVGLAQSDTLYNSYYGSGPFKEVGTHKELRYLFSLYGEPFHIVARKDSHIRSFNDLKGKIVNTGNPGTGTEQSIYFAMSRYGLEPKSYFAKETKLSNREQGPALCDGKIDAFIFLTALKAATITETVNTCGARVMGWWDSTIEKMLKDTPGLARNDIPAKIYEGQADPQNSWGAMTVVVTTTRLPDEVAYYLTKAAIDNLEDIKQRGAHLAAVTRNGAVVNGRGDVPYHAGALKYYREVGLLR